MDAVGQWEKRGRYEDLLGHRIFVVDEGPTDGEPVLILHGFPTCSFDWRHVIDAVGADRRVIAFDLLGYGLSDKPFDHAYTLFEQADIAVALLSELGVDRLAMITHDVGDSVGGEILARSLEGALPVEITGRVISNGSIYMDLVQLSAGQQLLLSLPDEPIAEADAPNEELVRASLNATFAPGYAASDEELGAQWALIERNGGNRLLPKLIRYVEERLIHGQRWTGAIEAHQSPLTIVWGEQDPIAVLAMAERLAERRPDAAFIRLSGVGHYPMIEAPLRFATAAAGGLIQQG